MPDLYRRRRRLKRRGPLLVRLIPRPGRTYERIEDLDGNDISRAIPICCAGRLRRSRGTGRAVFCEFYRLNREGRIFAELGPNGPETARCLELLQVVR